MCRPFPITLSLLHTTFAHCAAPVHTCCLHFHAAVPVLDAPVLVPMPFHAILHLGLHVPHCCTAALHLPSALFRTQLRQDLSVQTTSRALRDQNIRLHLAQDIDAADGYHWNLTGIGRFYAHSGLPLRACFSQATQSAAVSVHRRDEPEHRTDLDPSVLFGLNFPDCGLTMGYIRPDLDELVRLLPPRSTRDIRGCLCLNRATHTRTF